ncbi:plasmid segregation protein ParM domain-containing protein, partial [Escherichia coli]|uniref:plasmid segregation protein ParM domain-containing protein n=1 Tax=Escherichia coli TaxID=562 RepID=UPI0032D9F510
MAELLKSESPVSQSLQDITEALKIVVDDGSKAAKLVCLNERNELVPLLTQNSFVPDFRVRHEGLNPFNYRHCCKVSDEAAFCLIQRPYISKTLLT